MSDLFGEWVPHEMLRKIFRTMEEAPQHTYQILTKRHEGQRDFMQWWVKDRLDQPPPNWWFGVSIEDQRRADERIPVLLDTPAAVRWVSSEPLLGPLNMTQCHFTDGPELDWVVIGGESGPGARPFHIEWARSIIAQCKAAGVACFVKQLGAHPIIADVKPFNGGFPDGTHFGNRTGLQELNGLEVLLRHRKGADPTEWPQDFRVREYPKQQGESR